MFTEIFAPKWRRAHKIPDYLPKNGMVRPTSKVETTNDVLMTTEYICCDLWCFEGINSSRLIATGEMVSAYVLLIKDNKIFIIPISNTLRLKCQRTNWPRKIKRSIQLPEKDIW